MTQKKMQKIRYFGKQDLEGLLPWWKKNPAVKGLAANVIDALDPDTRFPVIFTMAHNDLTVRCIVSLTGKDNTMIEVPFNTYNTLPTAEIPAP